MDRGSTRMCWHREEMVSSTSSGLWVTRMNTVCSDGSSMDLSSMFAVCGFIFSGSQMTMNR